MTFADKTSVVGRRAASILELDLDACSRSYGVSPCTATTALANRALQSETMDVSPNSVTRGTVTANTTVNPVNGATTADSIFETAVAGTHFFQQVFAGIDPTPIRTYSHYVKGNGRTKVQLRILSNTTPGDYFLVKFDLASQTIISTLDGGDGQFISANIKAVGTDGFYRLSITGIADALGGSTDGIFIVLNILNDSGSSTYTGDITKGVIVFGTQLRDGLFPGKYAVTTTAAVDGGGTVDNLCFNTFGTCQDTANYLKEVRTCRFIDRLTRPIDAVDIYPAIKSVSYGATQLKPGGKFSVRGKVTVTLIDFAHNDIKVDDYQDERTYDQETQGTFFGKLKERNPYYIGRPMRVLEGYIDSPFDLANFRTREYIIENIEGPSADGIVKIIGKDVLALARNDRAKAPTASTWTLRAAMTDVQTTLLPQISGGEAAEIVAGDKYVRVDDEIMLVGTESPTDTVNVTRAQGGTDPKEHKVDATVQECLTYEDVPVIDVIDDLLQNFANVPASFIPYTDWEAEETESLTGYDMETIISTPTGVTKLLQEICEITLIDLWYSDVDQEIKLKLQTPYTDVTETWDDDDNIIEKSVKVKDLNEQRLSRVLIYYGRRNFAKDKTEPDNYAYASFEIETDKEGVNKYDDQKIRTIFSPWFDESNSVQVALTSQRILARFGITPIEVTFDIDAKDVEALQTGDVYDLNTRVIQDTDGTKKTTRFQITETKPIKVGHSYRYKSMAFFQDPTPESLIISGNVTDYDVFVELGGPPGPIDVTLTINTGVDVTATNGNAAITTAGMHPDSTIDITNNGDVMGHGGAGGKGGGGAARSTYMAMGAGSCLYRWAGSSGYAGISGGDCIDVQIASITIDNTSGNLWAGAGGGGGGGRALVSGSFYCGGGGGGGLGTDTGDAGPGGVATEGTVAPECSVFLSDGDPGTDGSTSSEGTGGAGASIAGDGGDGGIDWGEAGSAGDAGDSAGFSGGPGGYAIRLNGATIDWEGGNNSTQVKGDVG